MDYFYLLLSFISLFITGYLIKVNSNRFRNWLGIALLGLLVTIFILIFPLIKTDNLISTFFNAIIYAIRTVSFNQDLAIISDIEINFLYEWIYLFLIYALFLLIPLTTATFILSLVESAASKLRIFISNKRKVYIFSAINEKTVTIASKLANNSANIIFIDTNSTNNETLNKKIKMLNAIKVKKNTNIKLRNFEKKDVEFYLFSDDINKNLDDTINIINKYKNKNKIIKVFTLIENDVDETILDSMDKGNIQLNIIDEDERTIYQLLDNVPLYKDAKNNEIKALIIADESLTSKFIKTITWCGQIINYSLKIVVLNENAIKIKAELEAKCPELLTNYDIEFINDNLYSPQTITKLKKIKNINYVVTAEEDDKKNIEYGLFLHNYFLNEDKNTYSYLPLINIMIRNDLVSKQVNVLKNEKNNYYNFNTFGSVKNIYFDNYIINSKLEELTKKVFLSYDNTSDAPAIKLKRFYEKEYNIKSSRALALHFKYKIFAVLKDEYSDDENKNLLLFKKKLADPQIFDELARNEHDRWMAYMRTLGYKSIEPTKVKKYRDLTKSYIHYLAKLHPCITPFDELPKVAEIIDNKSIITSDGKIIKKMVELMK